MRWWMLALLCCSCGGGVLREPDEYTGCATDEHWITFDDQEPHATVDDTMAPAFTQPTVGATLPSSTKAIFKWNQDPNDPGMAAGDVAHNGPGCNACCPQWNIGALTALHLPPISGNVYDVQFSTDGSVAHRVVTTLQEWTPTDALWQSWRGKTVSIRIWRMTLIANSLRPGVGGPFVAAHPTQFIVGN